MMGISKTRAASKEWSKVRCLAISRILNYKQPLSAKNIIKKLQRQYGISAERKTIYNDIAAINRIVPVEVVYGSKGGFMYIDVLGRCGGDG